MYKLGSTDRVMVGYIQEALRIEVDKHFGAKTLAAVIQFQREQGLVADGIVGRKTLQLMGILDTDLRTVASFKTDEGLVIQKQHLPKGEYIQYDAPILNDYLFLHHTAGWNNPYNVVDGWKRDDRGKVGTEFLIGGPNIKNGDDQYDGEVLQALPTGAQGWHLGATGSRYMARHSVGIELCNFGYLTASGKTYVGTQAQEDQMVKLTEEFQGHSYWHKYSDLQLRSLKKLILHISSRDNIDIREGLPKWIEDMGPTKAFGFQEKAYLGEVKGLLTHTNVRKDKTDCFPQQELVDMLLSL